MTVSRWARRCALDFLFAADLDPGQVAAILIEPVQGEGGFHVAPPALLVALRRICDEHGIMLIADEVQSGFARTGRMFAIEHGGIEPDLVVVAKSMGGGFPVSGVIGRATVMDSVEPGGLGGTYGGSPVACAAALAVLDIIDQEGLIARADAIGARLRDALQRAALRNDLVPIGNIRGLGAMVAFDLLDEATGEPAVNGARPIVARALDQGLILLAAARAARRSASSCR